MTTTLLKKLAALFLLSTIVGHAGADDDNYVLDPDTQITLPEGFEAELLYSVPTAQGSWVAMAFDPKGRIIVSDQDFAERLTAAGSAELQDASGKPIGWFFTEEQFRRMIADWMLANVSTAELDADFESRQGRTLEEIWNRLGA